MSLQQSNFNNFSFDKLVQGTNSSFCFTKEAGLLYLVLYAFKWCKIVTNFHCQKQGLHSKVTKCVCSQRRSLTLRLHLKNIMMKLEQNVPSYPLPVFQCLDANLSPRWTITLDNQLNKVIGGPGVAQQGHAWLLLSSEKKQLASASNSH